MKKLKLAIIGQGRSGRDIHGAFYKSEENVYFDIAAVVELDPERRSRAAEEYPGCAVYSDYTELFGGDYDLVVNDTYSEMHYPITRDLLLHGFNVLVEKPFARNYFECCELIEIARQKGVTLAVFQQTFLAPYYISALDIAKSGKLGDILQVNIHFNGFARRWDWQTIQQKMAGCVYNTGPHPIGIALGFLDFDPHARVEYSRIDLALASGDAEDHAKIIMSAPDKPTIDIEITPVDAFPDYNIKIIGTNGTLKTTTRKCSMKYIVDGENEEKPLIWESIKSDEGLPIFCSEKLISHEETIEYTGSSFDTAVKSFYEMLYNNITDGKPMSVTAEMAARIINVIEQVHAANPMPVRCIKF